MVPRIIANWETEEETGSFPFFCERESIKQRNGAGLAGAAERLLGPANQSAQGGIDGLLVGEMLSDVR
jgi:hypothetical protein